MKLTKATLKQLIKEEIAALAVANQPPWIQDMERLLEEAEAIYSAMPAEGKEYLTQNFEMQAQKWRANMTAAAEPDLSYDAGHEV
jgi:hypothetical protein